MTNADYYVNEYEGLAIGRLPWRSRFEADMFALSDRKRIGVWHVRLKEGKR